MWVNVYDKKKPENKKTYWVTIRCDGLDWIFERTYKNGKWIKKNKHNAEDVSNNVTAWWDQPFPKSCCEKKISYPWVKDLSILPKVGKRYHVLIKTPIKHLNYVMEGIYKYPDQWTDIYGSVLQNVLAWWNEEIPMEPYTLKKDPEKAFGIFPRCELNGFVNKNIVVTFDENKVKQLGFRKTRGNVFGVEDDWWVYERPLWKNQICLNVFMNEQKNCFFVWDNLISGIYDYQANLAMDPSNRVAEIVYDRMESEMAKFADAGIISGHVKGEYV